MNNFDIFLQKVAYPVLQHMYVGIYYCTCIGHLVDACMQNREPGLLRAMKWQKANFLTCAMQEANWEETTELWAILCLGLGIWYMLEAWEKWRQNAISHMSYHFVARFNISKHSTAAQLSYFSPHCRRSMILMPTAPKATAAVLAPPPRQRTLGKVKKWQKFVELHRSRMPLTRLL